MQTRKFGIGDYGPAERFPLLYIRSHRRFARCVTLHAVGQRDFIKNRENLNDGDENTNEETLPNGKEEARYTWIKGEKKEDGYVYGVKEADGDYHYEVRYDAGPDDLALFEKKDGVFLKGLLASDTLRKVRPAVWYLWSKDGRPADIGKWWHDLLVRCHYYDHDGDDEIQAVLQQAAKDEPLYEYRSLITFWPQAPLEICQLIAEDYLLGGKLPNCKF